jgi:oligopeptide transport system permease protein
MLRLILVRLAQLPVILLVIFLITFTLAWIVPGNPLQRADARRPPPEVERAMLRQYNLDSPMSFLSGYAEGLLRGDLGPSLTYPDRRVTSVIAEGLPVSVSVGVLALAIALGLGTVAGMAGALRPGTALDFASIAVTLVGISLPSFVTGSALLVLFAVIVPLLPIGGWGGLQHLVLPALTLAVMPAAYIARLVRLGLAEIMASDYLRTAIAKGLSRRRALFRHAMKVAYLPVLSFMGPAAAAAMTGSFVVEQIFNLPGLGEHFVAAAIDKDQFLILGVVLVYSTLLVLLNLVVDLAYAWLDPRIALEAT